jgi:hypothetical protein
VPTEGRWAYDEGEVVEDSCNLDDGSWGEGDGGFALVNTDTGTFTIVPDDGGDPFVCTMSGYDFACEARLEDEEDLSAYGLDAVITVTITPDGTFLTASSMEGSQVGEAVCTGADCATAETIMGWEFPCILTVDFTASAGS